MRENESVIDSRRHPVVREIRQVRDGANPGAIFCEGAKILQEVFNSSLAIKSVFATRKMVDVVRNTMDFYKREAPLTLLSPHVMDFVSDQKSAPGVVALASRPEVPPMDSIGQISNPFILVLHQIQLPQNVGALIRSAEAAGVDQVWLTSKSAAPFSPKALRGASGSAFRMPILTELDLHDAFHRLQEKKIRVVAATAEGKIRYDEVPWKRPVALVMGSEGSGFTVDELKYLDDTIRIPMAGMVESLNVGTAGAICLFEANKHRRIL